MSSHMVVTVHAQTCQSHFIDPEVYKENLALSIRALYQPMGVDVTVRITPIAEQPEADYTRNWAVSDISLKDIGAAELRTIQGIAAKVFSALLKGLSPRAQ